MAKFEIVTQSQAELDSATGKRAEIMSEYIGYLNQLSKGQAGKLTGSNGESAGAIRRRLGAAAKSLGKEVVIKRKDDIVYFWIKPRRGRPRKIR
jgi:predicted RNA-binding protein YlqC (UPF0109 family)